MLTTTKKLNLTKLSFQTEADEFAFAEELERLLDYPLTARFVRPNTVQVLQKLYLTLLAEKSAFELVFYNTIGEYALLKDYFLQFNDAEYSLPEKATALEVFIGLAAKNSDTEYLFRFLEANILNSYQTEHLHSLLIYTFEKLVTFIDIHLQDENGLIDKEKRLLCELIELLPPDLFLDFPAEQLYQFFKEILPVFVGRFAGDMTNVDLFANASLIADWYQVWQRHQTREEAEILILNDDYYKMDFVTIIKYVPKLLWWQNGIFFRNEAKKFNFSSSEFLHIARGGSIRQALPSHPFTRRMAKVFSQLPYDFDQTGIDVYLYCYTKSLQSGNLLTRLLQNFIGNYPDAERMKIELDRWHPVIQKLACADFEELVENRAVELLGYFTHGLRDKPHFSVKRQTLAQLLRASSDYYQLIRERAQERERQQRLRDKQRRKEEKERNAWRPHNRVKPLMFGQYKVSELINRDQLKHEGRVMGHCVGTYVDRCKHSHLSIWSLRGLENGSWKSLVTIALSRSNYITEARARFNALPKKEHKLLVQKWAKLNGILRTGVLEEWDL